MENKLQELTDKLYKEGLSKGKEEGEAILAKANEKASEIIEDAKKQAESILRKAQKDAEDYKTKIEGDVKMAAVQSLQATRKDIENLMVGKMTDKQVDSALSSVDFIKEIIKAIAQKFNAEEAVDLNIVLPESLKKELEPFVSSELASMLKGGVIAKFSKKVAGGFTIGPKDGSYFISLTDETFKSLIGDYLRPATRK
ncbi:MAG TPA: V-type ATP synthase subunit E, partial [Rikenellaceae bacterium]|nr:V-type ATP synthase subunit E [Rikenellaceae bacterium]